MTQKEVDQLIDSAIKLVGEDKVLDIILYEKEDTNFGIDTLKRIVNK